MFLGLFLVLLPLSSCHRHLRQAVSTCERTVVFSAYQDGLPPPAFVWCGIMVNSFNNITSPRTFELLLHGYNLKYGLNAEAYGRFFPMTTNSQIAFLESLPRQGSPYSHLQLLHE